MFSPPPDFTFTAPNLEALADQYLAGKLEAAPASSEVPAIPVCFESI